MELAPLFFTVSDGENGNYNAGVLYCWHCWPTSKWWSINCTDSDTCPSMLIKTYENAVQSYNDILPWHWARPGRTQLVPQFSKVKPSDFCHLSLKLHAVCRNDNVDSVLSFVLPPASNSAALEVFQRYLYTARALPRVEYKKLDSTDYPTDIFVPENGEEFRFVTSDSVCEKGVRTWMLLMAPFESTVQCGFASWQSSCY